MEQSTLLRWIAEKAREGQENADAARGCSVKGAHYLKALRQIESRVNGILRAQDDEPEGDGG